MGPVTRVRARPSVWRADFRAVDTVECCETHLSRLRLHVGERFAGRSPALCVHLGRRPLRGNEYDGALHSLQAW